MIYTLLTLQYAYKCYEKLLYNPLSWVKHIGDSWNKSDEKVIDLYL